MAASMSSGEAINHDSDPAQRIKPGGIVPRVFDAQRYSDRGSKHLSEM